MESFWNGSPFSNETFVNFKGISTFRPFNTTTKSKAYLPWQKHQKAYVEGFLPHMGGNVSGVSPFHNPSKADKLREQKHTKTYKNQGSPQTVYIICSVFLFQNPQLQRGGMGSRDGLMGKAFMGWSWNMDGGCCWILILLQKGKFH